MSGTATSVSRLIQLAAGVAALAFLPARGVFAQGSGAGCVKKTMGALTLNIPSVEVTPEFRLNGQAFPGTEGGVAVFTLWASRPSALFDGPQLSLGRSDEPPSPVRVVPGTYDVYYSWTSGSEIPRTELTRLMRGVVIRQDRALRVNVPMVIVGGEKRHNGQPFETWGAADLRLRSVGRPGVVPLGGTTPAAFSVRLIPGAYAFEYDWQEGANLPRNRHAVLRKLSLVKPQDGLVLNVSSVEQDFQFLHNGGAFAASAYERGDIVLTRGEQEEVLAGSSHEGEATLRLVPGAYDVRWRHAAGAGVPRNTDGLVRRGLLVNGVPRIIDVPSVEVSGDYLVGGAPTPSSAYESASIRLVVPGTSDDTVLGQTHYGSFLHRLLPAVYDVVYEHQTGGSTLPSNPRATILRGWRVAAQPHRNIDIPVGRYAGSFFWNGEPVEGGSAYFSADVWLIPTKPGDEPVLLGRTQYGVFSRLLLPGAYRAAYAKDTPAGLLPWNDLTRFGPGVQVLAGADPGQTEESVDIPSRPMELSYAHNGAALPMGGAQNVRVVFQRGPDYMRWLPSEYGPAEYEALGGRFDLYYQFLGGAGLPRNAFMPFACWDLQP